MSSEIFYSYPGDSYGRGIILEDYQGTMSLVAAVKSQKTNGTVYKRWGFPQNKDRVASEKAIPWKIQLGNKREAVQALKYILNQLTNGDEPAF
jgi:hypothetical protein